MPCFCASGLIYGFCVLVSFAALVVHEDFGFDGVILETYLADLPFKEDPGGLPSRLHRPSVPNAVVLQDDVPSLTPNPNAGDIPVMAIVLDKIVLQPISVAGERSTLIPEVNTVLRVIPDLVVAQQIVGVFVANRDAIAFVALKQIVFKEAVPDAPAKEESIGVVISRHTLPDCRTLRTASRMQPQSGVVLTEAFVDDDIIGLLKTDAIATEAPYRAVLNDRAEAPIKKDAAPRQPSSAAFRARLPSIIKSSIRTPSRS